MKIFKHRNIMGCIFGLMLSLPLVSVLVRSAYVIVNKNAYESYSDQIVEQNIQITNYQNISLGIKYTFTTKEFSNSYNQFASEFSYISLTAEDLNITEGQYNNIDFILVNPNFQTIRFSNSTSPTVPITTIPYNKNITFDIIFSNFDSGISNTMQWFFVNQIILQTNKLDNVFEYSIEQTIKENNFGNINFLQWFEGMFLNNNDVNNRYLHYFNWYLNYTMFVSCAYILFLVLMWFVNFSRRLLERGMNYDW